MIPVVEDNVIEMDEYVEPSYTYKLDFENRRITGFVDQKEAIKQAIHKILHTERNVYMIYATEEGMDYGIELNRLIGKDMSFVKNDIERTITEALLNDERIVAINDFNVKDGTSKNELVISFSVKTIYGDIEVEEVSEL